VAARTVVIGVGNPYRRDDGFGPAVLERLARHGPWPGVRLVTCDGDTGRLLDAWEGTDLAYVVEAVRTALPRPGQLHRFSVPVTLPAGHATSSHGLGLGEAVELANVLGRLPGRLELLAVEVVETGLGEGLSAPVERAAEQVTQLIAAQLVKVSTEEDRCA
jgi:hydrogenase maturation protease